MADNRQIKFEVYAKQGTSWRIHTHYDSNYRSEAIDDAKRVERQAGISASCVMRVSYDEFNNESNDSVIYHTASLKTRPSFKEMGKTQNSKRAIISDSKSNTASPSGSVKYNAMIDYEVQNKEFQKQQHREILKQQNIHDDSVMASLNSQENKETNINFLHLFFAMLFSSIFGLASCIFIYTALQYMEADVSKNTLYIIFTANFSVVFLLIFTPMVIRILSNKDKYNDNSNYNNHTVDNNINISMDNDLLKDELLNNDNIIKPLNDAEEIKYNKYNIKPEDEDRFFPEDINIKVQINNSINKENKVVVKIHPEILEKKINKPEEKSSENIAAINNIKNILSALVAEAQMQYSDKLLIDSYLRFGAILFLAGTADEIAHRLGLNKEKYLPILVSEVEYIGASHADANGFCVNINEYLLDKCYLNMYNIGRNFGKNKLTSKTEESGFIDCLEYWLRPVIKQNIADSDNKNFDDDKFNKNFVAVLFTDIVDSTENQQKMGDEWMMKVVHLHNESVREALKKYNGQEIKHMGYGIMASFPTVNYAVSASIIMQEDFISEGIANPEYKFEVRIGISAGQPIHEGGDIFGTPVNLAARVLNKAGAGQIAVSSIVKDMCDIGRLKFLEIGNMKLKGFKKLETIFHVKYD